MRLPRPAGFQGPLTLLAGVSLLVYALWPWLPLPGRPHPPRTIVFYGFSILGEALDQAVLPTFERGWHARTGERVTVVTAFAGSGTITNQLIMGVPADLALVSLELDAERLAAAGVVAPGSWRRLPNAGVVNRTPFILLVRPGNPKGIRDFTDLGRPGVRVVHPDPMTSGGALWGVLAEYGSGFRRGGPEAGFQTLLGVWRNVVAQAASARAARTQFENGFGDVLVTYEQEALADSGSGAGAGTGKPGAGGWEIVYPPSTVQSEHTLVVVDRNVEPGERELVDALVRFLWSDEAQRLFVQHGFRSVSPELNDNPAFGRIDDPFLVRDFGGWDRVRREIVDGIWKEKVMTQVGR